MPTPRVSSSAPAAVRQELKQRLTLPQRLIRAGLAFILFGFVASLLPGDGVASAVDLGCSSTSPFFYRLTNDPMGGMDTVNGTDQPGYGTPLNFYVFQSTTGEGGPYTAFAPSSWSAPLPAYTGTAAGSAFNGMTHTMGSVAPAQISAVVPDGTLTIKFQVVDQGNKVYRLTNDPTGGPMTLSGMPQPNKTKMQFYVFYEIAGGTTYIPSSSPVTWTPGGAYAPYPGPIGVNEYDGITINGTGMTAPASIQASVAGGPILNYTFYVAYP